MNPQTANAHTFLGGKKKPHYPVSQGLMKHELASDADSLAYIGEKG